MKLEDIYADDRLEMVKFDLEGAANLIDEWLEGGAVDADLARYAGLTLLSLAERAPDPDKVSQHLSE
jgi:hypothetical protein